MTCAIEREDGDASARPHLSLRNDNEPWELKKRIHSIFCGGILRKRPGHLGQVGQARHSSKGKYIYYST